VMIPCDGRRHPANATWLPAAPPRRRSAARRAFPTHPSAGQHHTGTVLSQDLAWLLAVSAVHGRGFAELTVLGATMAEGVAPPSRRGEAMGIYGLAIAAPSLRAVPAGLPSPCLLGSAGWRCQRPRPSLPFLWVRRWPGGGGDSGVGAGYGALLNLSLLVAFARAGRGRDRSAPDRCSDALW
jgi:hypothetical protein